MRIDSSLIITGLKMQNQVLIAINYFGCYCVIVKQKCKIYSKSCLCTVKS